jgi:hypothetical protein
VFLRGLYGGRSLTLAYTTEDRIGNEPTTSHCLIVKRPRLLYAVPREEVATEPIYSPTAVVERKRDPPEGGPLGA